MAHYKSMPGTATYLALEAFFDKYKAARAVHKEWREQWGATFIIYSDHEILPSPDGVEFPPDIVPAEGWKYNKKRECWQPDERRKAGKLIAKSARDLPQIGSGDLGAAVGYQRQNWPLKNGGFGYTISRSPSVEKSPKQDCYVLEYDDRYTGPIPDDLIEILTSEARALTPDDLPF